MRSKNGYTVIELIVLIAVLGIVSLVFLAKTSYIFKDDNAAKVNDGAVIENQAEKYAESIKEELKEENTKVILVQTLIDNNYLVADENGKYVSREDETKYLNDEKIEINYNVEEDKINVVYPK